MVMLRVGVAIKHIENKHLQNLSIFWVRLIWWGTKKLGGHCTGMPPWLRPWLATRPHSAKFPPHGWNL